MSHVQLCTVNMTATKKMQQVDKFVQMNYRPAAIYAKIVLRLLLIRLLATLNVDDS